MNEFGLFLSAEGIEQTGVCHECERRNVPVVEIAERYFGKGSVGSLETATICQRCLPVYAHHAAEVLQSELDSLFRKRVKAKSA